MTLARLFSFSFMFGGSKKGILLLSWKSALFQLMIEPPWEAFTHLHRFTQCSLMCLYKKKKKKKRPGLSRVFLGRPGSGSTHRVNRVFPGQLPSGFLLRPGPILGPGRQGPKSTRRAGPGFKTVLKISKKDKYIKETGGKKERVKGSHKASKSHLY
jgi:hypothetical protein